uniref:tRNA(Ile)-lysidine synthase, chloroplastic n=1 Tax=Chondria sp. (in: red algae) TaxID=1982705 RepID=A0A1Z1MEB2_9FLOR|nr:tRNA Ile-lysidine synthetase [Chondria sp. (in: red algae)]
MKLIVAISGGQDSIYLMKLVEQLRTTYKGLNKDNFDISYIYIDHQWRLDCSQHVKHIINFAKSIGRKIYVYQMNKIINSEKICRINRYHILYQHAIRYGSTIIITGHNQTDKLETFLHNFFRGQGIEGLTSLVGTTRVHNNIYLLRPLLEYKRETVYWACKRYCLPVWSDTTNYIYYLYRNRTRHELVPYLKKYFHLNIESNIINALQNYYNHSEYIKQNTIKLYLSNRHEKYMAIDYIKLQKQNFILQFKTLQLFCIHSTNINPDHEKIVKLLININQKVNYSYLKSQFKHLLLAINKRWIYIKF